MAQLGRGIWAAVERVLPRGFLALTTVTAAAVTDPHAIGVYSWALLAVTFTATIADQPIRYTAVASIASPAGRDYLRRATLLAGSIGLVIISVANWTIASTLGADSKLSMLAVLAPLLLVPPAQAVGVQPTAVLQREGLWARVSLYRTIGALAGGGISIPVVLATRSIAGACIAVATSEVVYALLVSISVRRRPELMNNVESSDDGAHVSNWSTYRHMMVFSMLGWLQSQSERGLLGLWAGTSVLGGYSLGTAVGRSAGDSIATGQANVLRVDLSRHDAHSDTTIKKVFGASLRVELFLMVTSGVLTVIVSALVLRPVLGSKWATALQIVPILALTGIPLAIAASSAAVHVQRGRSRIAYIAPAICLLFAPLVAFVAMRSLTMAAWIVLLRECVLALTQSLLMGRATAWREVGIAGALVGLGSLAIVATWP